MNPYFVYYIIFDNSVQWFSYAVKVDLNDQKSRLKPYYIVESKNLGEECAELVAADTNGEWVLGESADVNFAAKVIALANGYSPIRLLNEEVARNNNPLLWLPD